jgi:renalase
MATRRVGEMQFDHGAQYVTARDLGFAAVVRDLQAQGAAAVWQDGSDTDRLVGVPGMSGFARAMAAGLDVRQLAKVTSINADGQGWSVHVADVAHSFDAVVITAPAPQIAGLLGDTHPMVADLSSIQFAPCLTLMAAVDAPPAFVIRSEASDPLAWTAQDSSKPGRPQGGPTLWVAQASPEFSARYLEDDAPDIVARMLPLLCDRLRVPAIRVIHAEAHRWRYARVTVPLGQPFLRSNGTLYAGGDWCIGPRVEAAWISGDAIAKDILGAVS